jgi:hypothetical protein
VHDGRLFATDERSKCPCSGHSRAHTAQHLQQATAAPSKADSRETLPDRENGHGNLAAPRCGNEWTITEACQGDGRPVVEHPGCKVEQTLLGTSELCRRAHVQDGTTMQSVSGRLPLALGRRPDADVSHKRISHV